MQKKELPPFYYLTHFDDLLHFVNEQCYHLINDQHALFLKKYQSLDKNSRCLLARIYSRKPYALKKTTLNYPDVTSPQATIIKLLEQGCIRTIKAKDIIKILPHLSKADLLTFYKTHFIHFDKNTNTITSIKNSTSKETILAHLSTLPFTADKVVTSNICSTLSKNWIINNRQDYFEFFEFLFFGRLSHDNRYRFHQFTLRDLGIRKTRKQHTLSKAPFLTLKEAQSAYEYHTIRQNWLSFEQAQNTETLILNEITYFKIFIKKHFPVGSNAVSTHNKIWQYAYNILRKNHINNAIFALQQCIDDDIAKEKELRERYKIDDKNKIKTELEALIKSQSSPTLKQFAQDFLTAKFDKKSIKHGSQTLKDAQTLQIDEQYQGRVERGVKEYYIEKGYQAYRTENYVFLNLFGLVFWDELYHSHLHNNEFELLPPPLKNNTFYTQLQSEINTKLARFKTDQDLYHYCVKTSVTHYGKANGLIKWRTNMLEALQALIYCSDLRHIKKWLINMAMHFNEYKSGYPDLMLEKDNKISFIEVKAQGDKLSRSQVITHQALKEHSFDVHVKKVAWHINPKTVYAVIDIETTGGRSPQHRMTEIAIVKVQNGQEISRWSSLINPQRAIPLGITRLTGISDNMVQNAPTFSELSETIREQLSGCIFVAHNVNFDYGFIQREFERLNERFKAPKFCTVVESRRAFAGLKSYSLKNLCKHFEINLTNHHRALADASATAELLCLIQQENVL